MKYTKIPEQTFQKLQLNAGILLSNFSPDTGEYDDAGFLGATSGGVSFTATPTYSDYGEDIDNAPVNVKELKKLDNWEITMSGNFVTIDANLILKLIGAADISSTNNKLIKPRNDISKNDFTDIWWIGDYSDVNDDGESGKSAGFLAIHMMNTLSTGGFQLQSGNRDKGQFAFEFTAHYSMENQDLVPFEVYIMSGKVSETTPTPNIDEGSESI